MKQIAPLWQATSSYCGAGDGFLQRSAESLQKFYNKEHFALPLNHAVSSCVVWVWEYSFRKFLLFFLLLKNSMLPWWICNLFCLVLSNLIWAFKSPSYPCAVLRKILRPDQYNFMTESEFQLSPHLLWPRAMCLHNHCQFQFLFSGEIDFKYFI